MHIKHTLYIIAVCVLFSQCTAENVYAAQVTFIVVPNSVQNDSATVVEARIDPKGESLNAIEGSVGILGEGAEKISLVVVETGGSAFSLWPVVPTYSEKEKIIRFTGGSVVPVTEESLVFRMRIFSETPNDISVSWLGGSLYRNDGEGTAVGVSSRSLAVSLTEAEPNQISASSLDFIPPHFEALEVSSDPDVQEGKYFLSFHATDDVSGILKYEVVEDQYTTEVTDGIYILRDQERKSKIVVIAYDQAGNSTSIKVPAKYDNLFKILLIAAILLFTGVLFIRWICANKVTQFWNKNNKK